MSLSLICFDSFITNLLTDLGATSTAIAPIIAGINRSVAAFNNTPLTNDLSTIVTSTLSCFETAISDASTSLGALSVSVTIALVSIVFCTIVIVALSIYYASLDYAIIIVIIAIIALVVATLVISLAADARAANILEDTKSRVAVCISTSSSQLDVLKEEEIARVNTAFCAY